MGDAADDTLEAEELWGELRAQHERGVCGGPDHCGWCWIERESLDQPIKKRIIE